MAEGDTQVTTPAAGNTDFLANVQAAKEDLLRRGRRSGPVFGEAPLVSYDQVFAREQTPSGTIDCPQALRVGSTQNALDVIVVASHKNGDTPLAVSKGATLTLDLYQSDKVNGEFEEVGPTICITAKEAMQVMADCLVFRFAIGDMTMPWAKVKLACTGISGGLIDVALAYTAR